MAKAPTTVATISTLAALVVVGAAFGADVASQPLEPPDRSSPRATLTEFISTMTEGYDLVRQEGRTRSVIAHGAGLLDRLLLCMDLRNLAPALHLYEGREAAVCLKEVLDRIELPAGTDIPDAAMVAARPVGLERWTIPHTEITFVRLKDGPQQGQYVFSAETVARAHEFYERVKSLPYKPGATPGLYQGFVSAPGWMIPLPLIRALPPWAHVRWGGQAVWQWAGLVLSLSVVALTMYLACRVGGRWARREGRKRRLLALGFPLFIVVVPVLAKYFVAHQLFITGRVFTATEFALRFLFLGSLVFVILGGSNRLGAAALKSPWFDPRNVDPQLVRLVVKVCGLAAAVAVILEGGRYMGLSPTTVIAGASVSGLALALAAQDLLKSVFGSLMILLDRPFQVGDKIRAKGYEGVVEDLGLRSTRIRLPDGHLVSISNEEMARLDIENVSRCPYLRRDEVIRLQRNTPPPKVLRAVEIARGVLEKHEGLDPKFPPRVHVTRVGPVAVVLTMTYWYHPPDEEAFAEFNQKVSLRLLEQLHAEGIQLA